MPPRPAPTLADLAALTLALARDEQLRETERTQRDQRVVAAVAPLPSDRAEVALKWVEATAQADAEVRSLRERVDATAKALTALVLVLGLLFGWGATLAVFYYDGSQRVNVLAVVAVLILIPALLLVPFAFAALPARVLHWLPGASALASLSRALNPGRVATLLLRVMPRDWREAWQELAGRAAGHHTLYAGVQTWTLLRWSQTLALGFQLAAVITALGLVAFSDLAFGWSTTLTTGDPAMDARRVYTITRAMARPWSWTAETAQPSRTLVETSRYFRAVAEPVNTDQAARLGEWWRFLVMTMLVYGLLPRIVTLSIAQSRLSARVRSAMAETPGLTSLIRRLHRARLQTTANEPEARGDAEGAGSSATTAADPAPASPIAAVVNWSSVPVDDRVLARRMGGAPIHPAGGAAELIADQALIAQLRSTGEAHHDIVIVVKAWEPPLLELMDFVRALRRALGPGRNIVVVPLQVDATGQPVPAPPPQVGVWRRAVGRVGDPWLHLGELTPEASP